MKSITCTYIGRFTVEVIPDFFGEGVSRNFWKNGELYGSSHGGLHLTPKFSSPCKLTRAQAYKYWERYFPNTYWWELPQALQDGLDEPPRSFGTFVAKGGEIIGYEG